MPNTLETGFLQLLVPESWAIKTRFLAVIVVKPKEVTPVYFRNRVFIYPCARVMGEKTRFLADI